MHLPTICIIDERGPFRDNPGIVYYSVSHTGSSQEKDQKDAEERRKHKANFLDSLF